MRRINVHDYDENGGKTLIGFFDLDKARLFEEGTRWDGNNNVSVHTTDKYSHEALLRTAAGRWLLQRWSQMTGVETTYQFIDDEQAKTWLLVSGDDDAVREFFGEIEEERGPGRPPIEGDPISIKLGPLQQDVDEYATAAGVSRAAAIRMLVSAGLKAGTAAPAGITQ